MLNIKVLLITGTPMRTDTNMGKTLLSLFSDFSKEELCQLYFSPETPNTDSCNSYYQVCETQILKSIFGIKKNQCGGEINASLHGRYATRFEKNALAFTRKKGKVYMRMAREVIWSISCWKNKNFKKWLKKENPNIIFTIMHDTNAATKAVRWIADQCHIPVVLFITDDYYHNSEKNENIMEKIYYKTRQEANKNLRTVCKSLVGCSQKAMNYFTRELNIPRGKVFYTPAADAYLALPFKEQNQFDVIKIRYFGNLGLGRHEVLAEIGKAIQKLNKDGIRAILEVYSSATDPVTIDSLTIKNGCVYKGWVYGEEYMKLLQDADIVVHAESFVNSNIRRTWVSVSTKIADSLGAGKCILAVGPSNIASMEHLKGAAYMVNKLDCLDNQLNCLISDEKLRAGLQKKARLLAMRDHDIEKIKKAVRNVLQEAVYEQQ